MSIQRSTSSEVVVEEVWGLGEVSFFPQFSGTPLGETDKEINYDSQEALHLCPLATTANAPNFRDFPWCQTGQEMWSTWEPVGEAFESGRGQAGTPGQLPDLTPSFPLPGNDRCLPEL